jgi:hypothetical protein
MAMIKRNLLRRLETLEERMAPAGERSIMDVVFIDAERLVSPKFGLLIFFRQSMVSSTLENRDPGCDRLTMERPRIFAVFAGSRSTGLNSGLTHSLAIRFTG